MRATASPLVASAARRAREIFRANSRSSELKNRFLLDIAKPSSSRIIGAPRTCIVFQRWFELATICRIKKSCWASLLPNTERSGFTKSNKRATTVSMPSKWPGREAPSNDSPTGPACWVIWFPFGYTSSTSGANKTSTPAADSFSASSCSVRGYFSKSSAAPNCSGFTKIETTTKSDCASAMSTSEM